MTTQLLADRQEIAELVIRYTFALDTSDWALLESCFTPDPVFVHPGGGPLRVVPFSVGDRVTATGTDIYDARKTERDVLILASDLHPGDSGSALVTPAGRVVGVAFAIAPDRPRVAYALAVPELRAVLAGPHGAAVPTGSCLA